MTNNMAYVQVDGTWSPIFSSYVFVNKVTFVYYMCVYGQQKGKGSPV